MLKFLTLLVVTIAAFGLAACSGGGSEPSSSTQPEPVFETFGVGRPQNRNYIGDVERAFSRYEATRGDMIARFKAQPWFQDGLDRSESIFVERSLAFASTSNGARVASIRNESIERKLFIHETVTLDDDELELLLIYEPGQDGAREMDMLKLMLPVLEDLVGVQYPERVMTIVNGAFEINDFSEGQFIRIARCCVVSPFILAHELAHTYWSMAPSWFNEGMADIYAVMTLERLNSQKPDGWQPVPANIESHYRSRRSQVESGRFPDILLPRRYASDGLYEAADVFLLDIRKQIGDEQFFAAARDIYLASDFGRVNLREKRIQDVFIFHAGSKNADGVSDLFNRNIWGDNGERYQEMKDAEGS